MAGTITSPYSEKLKQLTENELKLVEELRQDVASIIKPHADLQRFCNDWTYVRYLKARGWNLQKASKMLHTTLEWRLSFKPHEITWETISKEAATGKTWIIDQTDKDGRPVVMMRPRKENTKDSEGQIKFLVYTLEHASRMCDKKGLGKMVWLVDYEGYTMHTAPPLKVSLSCLNILQNHYPERLGQALNFHAPMLFWCSWKAISPFIDPVTHKKIVFINKGNKSREELAQWVDMSKMEECMGGDVKGELYNAEKYGKQLQVVDEEVKRELAALSLVEDVKKVADLQLEVAAVKPSPDGKQDVAAAVEAPAAETSNGTNGTVAKEDVAVPVPAADNKPEPVVVAPPAAVAVTASG